MNAARVVAVAALLSAFGSAASAEEPASLAKARTLYNAANYEGAIDAASVARTDAAWADAGDAAVIVLRSMRGRPVEGTIARVSKRLDPDTRTMHAEIDLKNADGNRKLLPGMYGEATLTLDEREALVLPAAAVRFDNQGHNTVYVVNADGTVSHVLGALIETAALNADVILVGLMLNLESSASISTPSARRA